MEGKVVFNVVYILKPCGLVFIMCQAFTLFEMRAWILDAEAERIPQEIVVEQHLTLLERIENCKEGSVSQCRF
jgi:hypothetical protein